MEGDLFLYSILIMFESEINTIIDSNLSKLDKFGPYLTLSGIASAGLHPALVTYLSAEIDYLVYSDRKKLISRSLFDYSGDAVESLFGKISSEIKTKAVLNPEETQRLIEQGVLFNLYFLLRPRWTLLKFIFNGEIVKPVEELKLSLNYIHFYPYIKEILLNFFDKKNLVEILEQEFKDLMLNIQEYIKQANKTEMIKNELALISRFLNFGTKETAIPLPAVEIYLKEKKENELLANIRSVFPDGFTGRVELSIIEEVLSRPVEPAHAEQPITEPAAGSEINEPVSELNIENREEVLTGEIREPETEIQEEYIFGDDTLFGVLNNTGENGIAETPSYVNPENVIEQEATTADEIIASVPEPVTTPETGEIAEQEKQEFAPALENSMLEDESEETFSEMGDELKDVFTVEAALERKSLIEFFSDKECNKIIADCFNDDEMDFINCFEELGEIPNYEEAVETLKFIPFLEQLKPDDKNLMMIKEKLEIYFKK